MVLFQAALVGKKVISYQPNLKTKDYSISSDLGLSVLIKNKGDLKNILQRYSKNDFPKFENGFDVIVPNATDNIIKLIEKLKYEKDK